MNVLDGFSPGVADFCCKNCGVWFSARVRNEETRKMEMATLDKIVEGKPVFWVTTQTSGLFAVTLDVKKEMVRKWREEADPTLYDHSQLQILAFKSSGNHAGTCVYSTVDLIEETGISLISDLDDTIKESDVHMGKRAAIKSAFFGDGIAVPGMSDAASPYQLFPTLLNFMIAHHFPLGSMHLRDIWAPGNMSTRSYKVACITQIFEHFPSRKFIFVGDSGEKDSEISATLHALFPDRILKIFIRDVTFLGPGGERRQAADSRHSTQIAHVRNVLAGLPEEKWSLFESSEALLLDEMVRRIILDSVEAKRNVVESGKGVVDEVHVLA
ncbi:hypothetical protein BC829DRAFT_402433 [Chytridium lagenaria]|nr:hypothetical protein BC829DRAFT_402433 [Chytridium lagenaria]